MKKERRCLRINMDIRCLKPADSKRLGEIIREGMPENIFSLTISSCHGYDSFISSLLETPNYSPYSFYGAYIDNKLAGFVEWRKLENVLFLNNIYILPDYRSFGIGKKLFNTKQYLLTNYEVSRIELDVFSWNEKAMQWYENLGFKPIKTDNWYIKKSLNKVDIQEEFYVYNLPEAKCMHKDYGFSRLEISAKKGQYAIGRLGNQYYRIQGFDALLDNCLINALSVIDPTRDYLVVADKEHKIPKDLEGLSFIASVMRMSLSL
ncbi:GNAT family N-acetyltransferase [Metabacillus idriensis]|uniref:GNAT family N-acetyltransferase n=1 Tax=Metabacillus idriensis TaxID=324768 RepID=UPI00281413E6|nr:GNAT family N-acetyltransferase [Metabacillus idriensis]MDR0138030.1 GNAT family N-acetyltransferase [Metabacillus idriensis]